jgi:hypothetical protein
MRKGVLRVTDGGVSGIILVKAELMDGLRCRVGKFVWPLFCLNDLKLDEFFKVLELGGEYYCGFAFGLVSSGRDKMPMILKTAIVCRLLVPSRRH